MSDPNDIHGLDEIEAMLRELDADDLVVSPPPPDVWAAIEHELAGDRAGEPPPTNVVALRGLRRLRPVLAVAAAVVLVVAAAAVVIARQGSDTTVVATARLAWDASAFDPLGADASANAELLEHDGRYEIRLVDATLPASVAESADLELWLIAVDAEGNPADIAPVALVEADRPGTYVVPSRIDPNVNTVVDISIEPRDGDTAHSGRSILRGPLEAA
jgi:anti-sigma-K factor RskA